MFPSLRLQDLNESDINAFVTGRLAPHTKSITGKLIQGITHRVEGVFLWAVLVVASILAGALDGDDEETLQRRLDTTPSELNVLFAQLLAKVDDVHYDVLKLCLFHLKDEEGDNDYAYRGSIGLITASMPASAAISDSAQFLHVCVKSLERLVAIGKGLIEVLPPPQDDEGSAWTFDFSTRKLLQKDLRKAQECYGTEIQFVHRSAHDFFFGHEANPHAPWALKKEDLQKLTCWTLSGMKTLFQYGPMVFDKFSIRTDPTICAPICKAVELMQRVRCSETAEVFKWLDGARKDIGDWYPAGRRSLDMCNVQLAGQDPSWLVESEFWWGSLLADGYLQARWDVLAQTPHARAICSRVLCCAGFTHSTIVPEDRPLSGYWRPWRRQILQARLPN